MAKHVGDAASAAGGAGTGRAQVLHETLARQFPAALFHFDARMADGYYADRYFVLTAATIAHAGLDPVVMMQLFAKRAGVVAGVYEAVRMLQTQLATNPRTGARYDFADITIDTLVDGDLVVPWEPVMHITGPYLAFAHLETDYLGVIARRTLIATNVRHVIDAANGKPVIFMGARHDDWRVQTADGFAAKVGGIASVSTDANGAWWGAGGVGTMPHSMIAAFGGDVVRATLAFAQYCRDTGLQVDVVSLTDYHNDVVGDSLAVARAMRDRFGDGALWGVRIDTSEQLVDRSLEAEAMRFPERRLNGVCPELVRLLRAALDSEGFQQVKIGVSGGFHVRKIEHFEAGHVPVDFYGVGSSLLGHNDGDADGLTNNFDFTADVVRVDGHAESKTGREERGNARFVRLDHALLKQLDSEAASRAAAGRKSAPVA
ncbi:MAG: quinolinate phosphoribosyl transferase [Gemmatimonadaceae bacterium]